MRDTRNLLRNTVQVHVPLNNASKSQKLQARILVSVKSLQNVINEAKSIIVDNIEQSNNSDQANNERSHQSKTIIVEARLNR